MSKVFKLNLKLLVLLVCTQILLVQSQRRWYNLEPESKDVCSTPHNIKGVCVSLNKCYHILELVKDGINSREEMSYIKRSICRFRGGLPDVCCPPDPVNISSLTTWSGWGPWSQCSARCDSGTKKRTCQGQGSCMGEKVQITTCNQHPCPVNGRWSTWSEWSQCSVSCGDNGIRQRTRECNSPVPSHGGKTCQGEKRQENKCPQAACPTGATIPTLDSMCGTRIPGTSQQFRVVGGVPAKLHAHPWIAALGYKLAPKDGEIGYLCGGTLITNRHILTAAHCIRDDLVTVLLGEQHLEKGTSEDGASPVSVDIKNVTTHHKYNKRNFNNDIAVITLSRDVQYNDGIRPACLPSISENLEGDKFEYDAVVVAGWGATKFRGPQSPDLLEGTIKVVNNTECSDKFKAFRQVKIIQKKLCARDLNNKIDTCQGDSGGPLVTKKMDSNGSYRYFLIGVVSFGYRCAVPGFPGVYTRVSEYDDWIREIVMNE